MGKFIKKLKVMFISAEKIIYQNKVLKLENERLNEKIKNLESDKEEFFLNWRCEHKTALAYGKQLDKYNIGRPEIRWETYEE